MNDYELDQYKNIIISFYNLQKFDEALHYLKDYENYRDDLCYYEAVIYDTLKDNKKAIYYYEQCLKYFNEAQIYCNLYRLYADEYVFGFKEKQLYYIEKAYELFKDRTTLINRLLAHCKFKLNAEECYEDLKDYKLTPDIIFSYGCYLISQGNFKDGFALYRYRIEHDQQSLPDGLKEIWQPNIDLKDKTILVTYEQGFGDTLMFIRFLKDLKPLCKELKVVVQEPLFDLLKDNVDVPIYKDMERGDIEYDYFVPMMDIPLLIGLTPDKITQKDGYILVPENKINEYTHIQSNKPKIGICFAGSKDGIKTCRDIPLKEFYSLFELDAQFYLFQKEDLNNEIPQIPEKYNVIPLGDTFNSWLDTACAMKHLDLMITIDCGVLNLAGACGIPTFALFNEYPEFRWFSLKDDIGWYNMKPFQCEKFNEWSPVITKVKKELIQRFNLS